MVRGLKNDLAAIVSPPKNEVPSCPSFEKNGETVFLACVTVFADVFVSLVFIIFSLWC
jgi:hypothetical protein